MINRYALGVIAALAFAGCGSQVAPTGAAMTQSQAHPASGSYGYCPANPSGSGILPDGDFSQGVNYGDAFIEPSKGSVFAPGWEVAKRTIDFNGSTGWGGDGMDGLCSVDLDGNSSGGIETSAFKTKRGTSYTVSFLLSGNGGDGKGNPPVVKTMKIEAAHQFAAFTWNTANDNDIEHDKYAEETWQFRAQKSLTVLRLMSQDPKASSRGAVVGAIAISAN